MKTYQYSDSFRALVIETCTVISTVYFGLFVIFLSLISRDENRLHRIAQLWASSILLVSGAKVKIRGLTNINPEKPYIYMANHQSLFDIPVLLGRLPVQFRWLAKAELFLIPIFGPAMKKAGYISIDRDDRKSAFQSIKQAAERIRGGVSVLIFPEGTRSHDGKLKSFKKGGFIMAVDSQVPIVPIIIRGTGHIMPKKRMLIRRGNVTMDIVKPIETTQYSRKTKDLLMEEVRNCFSEHIEERQP